VESARQLAEKPPAAGVLAPAQAFGPATFLDFLTRNNASWSIETRSAITDGTLPR
jgi:hypothetical protein